MRNAYAEADIQMDNLFHILEKPLPSSLMTDPQYFLSVNEDAIMRGLGESRREQRRLAYTRYSAAFGVFAAITMLFTFSREARAFAREVFYTVIEWFSPNESGVTFDIEDSAQSSAPAADELTSEEKISFQNISEVDKLYSHSIFVLKDAAFSMTDGYVQNETICLNYQANGTKVQVIAEPIQSSGSVTYHFNEDSFDKTDVASLGTLYYNLTGDTLFGGIMTSDTNIIIHVPSHASPELLELIVNAISLYR